MAYINKMMEDYSVASLIAIENSQVSDEIKVAIGGIGCDAISIQEGGGFLPVPSFSPPRLSIALW